MKYLMVLMLVLSGCAEKPKFKVGDVVCITVDLNSDSEFQKPINPDNLLAVRIKAVGKKHYLYLIWDQYSKHYLTDNPQECPFFILEDRHVCSNEELAILGFE